MLLQSILLASASTLGKAQTPTGIVKVAVSKPVELSKTGLDGDFQVDKRVHGGLEKAVYQYPFENYEMLSSALPHLLEKFKQPCLGENFSSTGMQDDTVFIGDVYRVGSALLQVSQPRMPCWKLNQHIGNAHMQALLIALNRSGWYYRVLETGTVQAGNDISLVERIQEDYSVQNVWERWSEMRETKQTESSGIQIKGLSNEWTFNWGN